LLITTGAILLVLDTGGCAKHRLAGGLSKLTPCRLPGIDEELLCGKLTVFENQKTRTGRTIDLNVVVLPAFDQKNKAEPLFDLAGGPGASSTEGAPGFYAGPGKAYRRQHDVVCVDQRGTGKSNRLAIPREKTPQYYLSEMFPIDYVKNLRETLEPRADLTKYTTSIAMDDLDDVRAWLGYDRINLFGGSYGTRAALVYMRQHPEHVRSAILVAVAPTDLKMPLHHSESGARAMDLLLSECEQDARCNAAFPQIRDDWKKVLAQLEKQPARVEYSPAGNGAPTTVEIQSGVFAEKIRSWMYGRDKAARIPLIVHHAANGDFTPFLKQAVGPSIPDFVADGMYLSVTCAEDVPFINQEEAAKLNAGNPFGNYRVFQQTRACGMWPRGEIPPDFHQPVHSHAPVLIFSGNMDPVTPPTYGDEVARHLPNSRHIVIAEAGHEVDGLTDPGCMDRIAIEFLDKGDAKNLDVNCVERMAPPPFVTN
jgi:pimeloyl-ACP methyl ester carboxylesterase